MNSSLDNNDGRECTFMCFAGEDAPICSLCGYEAGDDECLLLDDTYDGCYMEFDRDANPTCPNCGATVV